ncbi:MAG: type II toxin-antitoxin system VapC family toxin [Novosphingobium sp.]
MILVDSSIWIDHLRLTNAHLVLALAERRVLQHPFVTAELALGSIRDRARLVTMLRLLPQANVIEDDKLYDYIDECRLFGTGIGMVDVHLLASAADKTGIVLWTRDRKLSEQAARLSLNYVESGT